MRALCLFASVLLLSGCEPGVTIGYGGGGGGGGTPPQSIPTSLSLATGNTTLTVGQTTTFTATVTPSAAPGSVSVVDSSDAARSIEPLLVSAALQSGTASLPFKPEQAGLRSFTVAYSGGDGGLYSGSGALVTLPVHTPLSAANCGLGDAVYLLSAGTATATPSQVTFNSAASDESAICAQNTGTTLTLNSPNVTKSGGAFYELVDASGIDAAVLAYGNSATTPSGATINLLGSPTISVQNATYAAFASGLGSTINLTNATLTSVNSQIVAGAGNNGQLTMTGTRVTTGYDLLALVNGGSVTLTDTSLSSSYGISNAAGQIYMIGPSSGTPVTNNFSMTGGSIQTQAALFTFTGTQTDAIYLSAVSLPTLTVNYLMELGAPPITINLTLDRMQLTSGILNVNSLRLQNGTNYSGNYLGGGSLSLDASSSLTLHGSLAVTTFSDPAGISGNSVLNIVGNGQTLSYSKAMNPQLGGLTYNLVGSGTLVPY